jgi:hypothetical protein
VTGAAVLVALLISVSTSTGPTPIAAVDASSTSPRRQFEFKAQALPQRIRQRVTGSSWHAGCPVALDRLRYIRMTHWGFDGKVHGGVMIVNVTAVAAVEKAFGGLFAKRFPVRRMHLVDDYGADDFRSIEADNSSSFNCRRATGSTRWSEHAYGRAIDVNPIENP